MGEEKRRATDRRRTHGRGEDGCCMCSPCMTEEKRPSVWIVSRLPRGRRARSKGGDNTDTGLRAEDEQAARALWLRSPSSDPVATQAGAVAGR